MVYIIIAAWFAGMLIVGYISGNQPKRNAVNYVKEKLALSVTNRAVKVGNITLNVVFAGPEDGKPVLLLHGYPEFWFAWRGPMAVLAKAGFRVIVPDQRGYNDSEKPQNASAYSLENLAGDIAGLIESLNYKKVFLAGHDFGGLVAWWTLILHPDKVEKFIIINKPHPQAHRHYPDLGDVISWYRTFLRIPWLPGYVARLGNWFLLVKNLKKTSLPGTFLKEEINQFRSAWANDGAINSMGAWYRANANFLLEREMYISVPGLFIQAPEDAYSPKGMGELSLIFLEHGTLLHLDEGTHWIIQERPKLIGDIFTKYFKNQVELL